MITHSEVLWQVATGSVSPWSETAPVVQTWPLAVGRVAVNTGPKPPATHSDRTGQSSESAWTLAFTACHADWPPAGRAGGRRSLYPPVGSA